MSKRIQITRDELLEQFPEVQTPPEILQTKFAKAPFCHLLSTYVIRPVACDQLPFFIHHKNKQPIFMQEKKTRRGGEQAKQVDNFDSSSEDEFEKVKTEKKRGLKKPEPAVEFNPKFPASDPTKVKVITAPAASGKKVGKINIAAATAEAENIVRPNTARKEGEKPITARKEAERPTTARKAAKPKEDNPWMAMKKADEGQAAPKEEVKAQPPKEEKKAAPKKEAPKKAAAPKKEAPKDDPNDFMAQMQRAAALNEE